MVHAGVVPTAPRRASGPEWKNELEAERRLADLDIYADLAALYDEEMSARLKRQFAEQYRALVGVHPKQRIEFAAALERIRDGGGTDVADVIAVFVRDGQRKSSLAGSVAADD